MTRKELCKYFTGDTGTDEIIRFKQCLDCDEIDQIDNWLAGVINSLYWRPNKLLLVFCGIDGLGKSAFISNILPNELNMYSPGSSDEYNSLISSVIVNSSKSVYKFISGVYLSDCFKVDENGSDKRLTSIICEESSWPFPQRKTVIVLNLKSINLPLFFKIDKKKLWQQIYNRYKQ